VTEGQGALAEVSAPKPYRRLEVAAMRQETVALAERLRTERSVPHGEYTLRLFQISPEDCKHPTGSWQLAKVDKDGVWVDVGETFESDPVGQWDPVLTLAAWLLDDDDG
jgi:hypothetical protein